MIFRLQFGPYGIGFRDLFYRLQVLGVFDVLIPFVLIFTILYAVLQKVGVFKEKKFNILISLAIALLVVVPHVVGGYPAGFDVVEIINRSLPQIGCLLIAFVLFLIMVGLVWKPQKGTELVFQGALVPIIVALILFFIFSSAIYQQAIPNWLWWILDPTLQMFVVILLIFGLVVWFVTSGAKEEKEGKD
ncbi:MAG: hypothetical protein QXN46_02080 [Candidatus Woesearchaeota archaeon]